MSVPPPSQALLDALPDAAWLVEMAARRVVAANAAAGRLLGRPSDSLLGCQAEELATSPEDLAWWLGAGSGDATPLQSDVLLVLGDGASADTPARALHAHRCIRALAGTDGEPLALVTVRDRSAEQQHDEEREARLLDLQATLESAADGLLVTDLAGRLRAFNRRFAELWGLPAEMLTARDDAGIHHWMRERVRDGEAWARRLQTLAEATLVPAVERIELADGRVFERSTRALWRNGRPQGRVWSYRDLSEKLAAEQRIEALEHCDALTGLPNRRHFGERVEAALQAAQARRRAGESMALLVIDLDRFGQINDSLGQEVGDRVLQDAARRIAGCLRDDDVLARIGGDQFALLLQPADGPAAETTARRILNLMAQPHSLDGADFTLTCSIGIALAPAHANQADELLRHAETAMRQVKHAGRSHVRLHQRRGNDDRRAHMTLDHAMRQALVSGRFRLQYQPQVRLSDGMLVGAEALLRWRDPELGEVSPGRFIPVAEASGFIVAIGDWVLAQAVRQVALWYQRGHSVPVAVNVSALQFQQPQFVDRVAGVLAVSGIPPQLLELELTESILVHDVDEALARLHALARLGVRLSIDDFGTGYSSLAYLKRFPIGKLKIDRSFVTGLPGDEADAGIVRAILQMARALGMKVIAEGVETEVQRQFLAGAGCDEFQGWLYAPALDPLSFEQRLVAAAPEKRQAPRIRLVTG
jgi:diguanylate cyclase (GGDEF)-like protein/PAS domain S-box-containing protein